MKMRRNGAPQRESEPAEGITSITVAGYKSIGAKCTVAIRPLTILAGANSSGKSSIIQPLLLLKQTLESPYDPGPLRLDGPHVRFTKSSQLFSRVSSRNSNQFEVGCEISSSARFGSQFRKSQRGVEIAASWFTPDSGSGETIRLSAGMSSDQIRDSISISKVAESDRNRKSGGKGIVWSIHRDRCFLEARRFNEGDSSGLVFGLSSHLLSPIAGLLHVPGLRGNPSRTYKTTAVGEFFPGTFEDYAASVIAGWQSQKDIRLIRLHRQLSALGLTWKIHALRVAETQVELRVGRLVKPAHGGANDLVSIADVGIGISQVLPVLVALLQAKWGQLVYIEQPESHLHPRAQVELANVLIEAANHGVRVVTETHSSLLLLALQTAVAKGDIDRRHVILHWFQRTKDGASEITSREPDETGAYGDWPEDFGDVILETEARYLKVAQARSASAK